MRFLIFTLCISGLVAFLAFSPTFKISRLFCQVDTSPCPPPVLVELNQLKGLSVFLVKTQPVKTKLAQANPAYRDINFQVQFPNSIRLEITSRQPFAVVKISTDSAGLVVDQDAVVLPSSSPPAANLALIIAPDPQALITATAVKLAGLFQDYYLPFNQIMVTPDQVIQVSLPAGTLVRFSPLKDLTSQLRSLQLILKQATIVEHQPRIIDVRFDKPILN